MFCISCASSSIDATVKELLLHPNNGDFEKMTDLSLPGAVFKDLLKDSRSFNEQKFENKRKSLVNSLIMPKEVKIIRGEVASTGELTP